MFDTNLVFFNYYHMANLEINIFGIPDTMSSINQFVSNIKEIVTNLYQTMTMTGYLFQGLYEKFLS